MSNEALISTALLKTDPSLYSSIDGGNSFQSSVRKRGARVSKYRRYVNGEHDACLTDQMKAMLRLKTDDAGLNDFNLNYMGVVVDKMAGRLNVNAIENVVENTSLMDKVKSLVTQKKIDPAQEWINKLLIDNDFESIQGMFFRGAIRDGDSYVMIDPQTAKWLIEPAYDGFSGVFAITRQGKDAPIWACKLYSFADLDIVEGEPVSTVKMKVVVYQPDKISYFEGSAAGGDLVDDPDVTPQVKAKGQAWGSLGIGIPIIHGANLKDSYTQYGESEIRKGIPLNDVLNRTIYSMVMASEFGAFKLTYSIGLELDKSGIMPGSHMNLVLRDDTSKTITDYTPEQVEFLKSVKVGELSASDISQYTNQIEKTVIQISHVTSTPIYGVTANGNISGEALKQLETGLVGKCQRFQKENTSCIRSLIEMTAKVQDAFAEFKDPPKLGRLLVKWDSAELRDNVIDKETQIKKLALETAAAVYTASNGGIAIETVLRMFGCFTDDELVEIGTQKMASIALEQEDNIPENGL
jgi:hypothetical protein